MLEEDYHDANTNERYIKVDIKRGACRLRLDETQDNGPAITTCRLRQASQNGEVIDKLSFVPYYTRANRGGKGHMKVGLGSWHR
jgi:hypothetical protein